MHNDIIWQCVAMIQVEEFRRARSAPADSTALRRATSTPADGRSARKDSYAVKAAIGAHFSSRFAFTTADDWLEQESEKMKAAKAKKKSSGARGAKRAQKTALPVEGFSITEIVEDEPHKPERERAGAEALSSSRYLLASTSVCRLPSLPPGQVCDWLSGHIDCGGMQLVVPTSRIRAVHVDPLPDGVVCVWTGATRCDQRMRN
jgi:hypothetical protein